MAYVNKHTQLNIFTNKTPKEYMYVHLKGQTGENIDTTVTQDITVLRFCMHVCVGNSIGHIWGHWENGRGLVLALTYVMTPFFAI